MEWSCSSCYSLLLQQYFLQVYNFTETKEWAVDRRLSNKTLVDCVWNMMAHAQKPDFIFRRNGRVRLNRRGRLFSRILAAGVCASAVVMLDTLCSEVVWRVLATHSVRQFPLHFPSRASPRAITFQLDSTFRISCRGRLGSVGPIAGNCGMQGEW